MYSLSHCWESREHPDPTGKQLQMLVESELYGGGFTLDSNDMVFIDYTCLFQFPRELPRQEDSFRRAMQNMHVLYAHKCSLVLRIENLSPIPQASDTVNVFQLHSHQVEEACCSNLLLNRTPYNERGWCAAESQWANMMSLSPKLKSLGGSASWASAPMSPEVFQASIESSSLRFTHRDDAEQVMAVHRRVFEEIAVKKQFLSIRQLMPQELRILNISLPHFLSLNNLCLTFSPDLLNSKHCMAGFISSLESSQLMCRLETLNLTATGITAVNADILATFLLSCQNLKALGLNKNALGDEGVQTLACVWHLCKPLVDLQLLEVGMGDAGAMALATAIGLRTCWTSGAKLLLELKPGRRPGQSEISSDAKATLTAAWRNAAVQAGMMAVCKNFELGMKQPEQI